MIGNIGKKTCSPGLRLALAVFTLAQLVSIHSARSAPEPTDDPRLLSTVTAAYSGDCAQGVSDDGHLLYLACNSPKPRGATDPSGPAKFLVYDISDLRSPRQISETAIGDIRIVWLVVRKATAFVEETFHTTGADTELMRGATQPILMIDVRDPLRPRTAGQVDMVSYGLFRVSDDGSVLALRNVVNKFKFFDTSDPDNPHQISDDRYGLHDLDGNPAIWGPFNGGHIAGIDGVVQIEDIRNGMALVQGQSREMLSLYKLNQAGSATLKASFPQDRHSLYFSLIPGADAIVFGSKRNEDWVTTLQSAVNLAFGAKRLTQAYDDTAKSYGQCADLLTRPDCIDAGAALAKLSDAGIDKLIDQEVDGISPPQRVLMLNNYGFWLYQWQWQRHDEQSLNLSARVLRKVTELSPNRTVAWLNLGDTLSALIPMSLTETGKAGLWREADKSYARYKELSGKDASGTAELAGLDLPALVGSAKNVCDYVADAYNHQRQAMIMSPKGTVTQDGKAITFVVGATGGSCAWEKIKTEGCEGENCDDGDKLNGLHFVEPDMGAERDSAAIVPFRGKYYTIAAHDHAPDQVIDPITGPICRFERTDKPVLVENNDLAVCQKYADGQFDHKITWSPLSENQIEPAELMTLPALARFDRATDANLGGAARHIAHFNVVSGGGCGCEHSGVALIDDHKLLPGEPNDYLIDYQRKWWICRGADADLTRIDGQTYVDAWAGKVGGSHTTPRVLLKMAGDKVRPMCRIERVNTVRPVPVGSAAKN